MKRFSNTLKVSVSIVALAAGGGVFAGPASGITLTGNQTGYSFSGDITDGLVVASGASVTPEGISISIDGKGAFKGDLVNNGIVQIIVDDDPAGTFAMAAIKVAGTLDGSLINNGDIEANELAKITLVDSVVSKDSAVILTPMFAAATTIGVQIEAVTGDFSNSGDIVAVSTAANDYDANVSAVDTALVRTSSRAFANATGIGPIAFDGEFVNNVGATVSAAADASTIVSMVASADQVEVYADELNSAANATGIEISGTIQNDGTISAASDAVAMFDAQASGLSGQTRIGLGLVSVYSGATGVFLNSPSDSLNNSGQISADAAATFSMIADSIGESAVVVSDSPYKNSVYATASGTIPNVPLTGAALNDGSIEALASADVNLKVAATASKGVAIVDLQPFDISALAYGVDLNGDAKVTTFTNNSSILADASTVYNDVSAVASTGGSALYTHGRETITSSASGVTLSDLVAFSNAGDIKATAGTVISSAVTVTADSLGFGDSATLYSSHLGQADAIGILTENLGGDFVNKGSVSGLANAASSLKLSATSAETSAGITIADSVVANAAGIRVDDLNGVFSHESGATISSAATAAINVSALANGLDARIDGDYSPNAIAQAAGVVLFKGSHSIDNAGVISATATATESIDATAQGTKGFGTVFIGNIAQDVDVFGLLDQGVTTGFDNSGAISAAASGSLQAIVSATASEGTADVSINNTHGITASGVYFVNAVEGDVVNSGQILASATGVVDMTVTSGTAGEPGSVQTTINTFVSSTGLRISFAPPAEINDESEGQGAAALAEPHSLTNSGTIAASGSLDVRLTLPAADGDDPFPEFGDLDVTGAYVAGDVGTVTNSGLISAVGSVNMTGAEDGTLSAGVVGLWLTQVSAGGAVINSGKIEASLTGVGATQTGVAAVVLGPDAPDAVVGVGSDPEDEEQNATAIEDVFTLTNSGTIAATNDFGTAYGVYAESPSTSVVINQQGGSISGDVAIGFDQGNADTLNWTGGEIHGVVDADEFDVVNVFAGTGTPANKTITAGTDFTLSGGAELNVGVKDAPVTFALAGNVTGTATVNVNDDANLLLRPTGKMDVGTLVMDPEATLTFEFDHDSAGLITTTGDAAIDGKLVAVVLPDLYGDKGSHTVVEAGGLVTGAFDNVSIVGDTLLLDFSAAVGEQDVTISWKRTPFNEVAGLTINSTSVATALEDGYDPTRPPSKNDPELNDILSAMFTLADPVKYDRVLNSWSGSEHAQLMRAAANLSEPYLMSVGEHLNDIRHTGSSDAQSVMLRPKGSSNAIAPLSAAGASGGDDGGFAFWGRAFGRWADTRGDVEADGYDEDTFGAVLGADFRVSPNVLLGIVGGYTDDSIDFDDGDEGKIKRWTIGGYVSATFGAFYVDASVSYAGDNYKMRRTIVYGDTSCLAFNCTETATARYDGDGWLGHAELGYDFDLGGASLRPFAGLNYASASLDPFSEAGGGDLGLDVLAGKGKSLQSRLGARLSGEWGSGGSTVWVPELRAEWRHEFKDDPAFIAANLTGLPNDPFVAIGSRVTGDLAVVGAGVTALMGNGVGVFFDYQGAFGSGYSSHIIQGGVRVRF